MELRLIPAPVAFSEPGFKVAYPDDWQASGL